MTTPTQISQWRTVGLAALSVIILAFTLFAVGIWCPIALSQYPTLAGVTATIVVAAAAKAYGEHKANADAAAKSKEPVGSILAEKTAG